MCSNALKLVILGILVQFSGEDEYVGQGRKCREQMGSSQINLGPPNCNDVRPIAPHLFYYHSKQKGNFKRNCPKKKGLYWDSDHK